MRTEVQNSLLSGLASVDQQNAYWWKSQVPWTIDQEVSSTFIPALAAATSTPGMVYSTQTWTNNARFPVINSIKEAQEMQVDITKVS